MVPVSPTEVASPSLSAGLGQQSAAGVPVSDGSIQQTQQPKTDANRAIPIAGM
jgi:hypothetical protein